MIKPIKKTPISILGADFSPTDYLEVLVEDDSLGESCCCDKCFYWNYPAYDSDLLASCSDIPGCTRQSNRYFIIEPINQE